MPVLDVVVVAAVVTAFGMLNWLLPKMSPLRRFGYRPNVHPPAGNVGYRFDPSTSWHTRGGVRIGRMNATYPLARLDVDRHCVAIRSVWGLIVIDRTDVLFPNLPPPPTSLPPKLPPPPLPPVTWVSGLAGPTGTPTPGKASSRLQTTRLVGRYVAWAVMVFLFVLLLASFAPSLMPGIDTSAIAAGIFPVIFVVVAIALLTSADGSRAHRPYRPVGPLSVLLLPGSWAKRLLLFGAMIIAVGCVALSFTGSTTDPDQVGDTFTVDRNGVAVVTDEAEYDRVRVREARPDLGIPLVFATFSYVMLADGKADTDGMQDDARR